MKKNDNLVETTNEMIDSVISESIEVKNGKNIYDTNNPLDILYVLLDDTTSHDLSKDLDVSQNLQNLYDRISVITNNTNRNPVKDFVNKNYYLRLAAEFENYKKRMSSQMESLKQSTKMSTLSSILDSWDDFMIAKKEMERSKQNMDGINLILSKLENSIKSNGLTPIENVRFNSNYHEAISTISIDGYEDNQIVDIISWGWMSDGKVVKWSKVVVNKIK